MTDKCELASYSKVGVIESCTLVVGSDNSATDRGNRFVVLGFALCSESCFHLVYFGYPFLYTGQTMDL